MATTEFDTLATTDELRAAGIQARHARAIVTAIGQSKRGLLTASRFEAALGEIRGDMKAGGSMPATAPAPDRLQTTVSPCLGAWRRTGSPAASQSAAWV